MEDVEFTHEPGEHPGWNRYGFVWNNIKVELLTIEQEGETRSQLYEPSSSRRSVGEGIIGLHFVLYGVVLTVNAAHRLLSQFAQYEERGITTGKRIARREMQRALGL